MTRSLSDLLKRNIGGDSRHRPVIRHYSLAGVTPIPQDVAGDETNVSYYPARWEDSESF